MRPISPRVRAVLVSEPDICARRSEGGCAGRITWEHAVIYAGRQLDEAWAIVKLCERHHSVGMYMEGGLLDKSKNVYLALCRATDEDMAKYPKGDYKALKVRLSAQYAAL